jgi:acid phosphatase (class A)
MELLSREPEMSTKALILIANMLFALTACATPAAPPPPAVNPVPVAAAAAPATALPAPPFSSGGYLTPVALNLYRLLPPPPVAGSAQERSELDELLHLQATRTPAEVRRAQGDATISIFRFADALGNPPDFTPKALPRVAELFDRVLRDENLFMDTAKDAFGRPRPFVTEERLNPVVPRPPSASYPSGHTTWAIAVAIVLSDMVPERRSQIFTRADEYARNREVGGVHYPSDVAAGHLAGTALAQQLFNSARFVEDEVAAADELRRALGLQPLPRHQLYRH